MPVTRPKPKQDKPLRSAFLRWELGAVIVVMIVILGVALYPDWEPFSGAGQVIVTVSLMVLTASLGLVWFVRGRSLRRQLEETERDLEQTQLWMSSIFRLSHQFVQATEESEIVDFVLQTCVEIVGAEGVSFVPLDQRGQPLPAVTTGNLPDESVKDWVEHLASPGVRTECAACEGYRGGLHDHCPLVPNPFIKTTEIYCLPVKRGDWNLGILNLYLNQGYEIDSQSEAFLFAMLDEMAMAVEAIRLRNRELSTIAPLQVVEKPEPKTLLPTMLGKIAQALKADFAYLGLYEGQNISEENSLHIGTLPSELVPELQTVVLSLRKTKEPSLFDGSSLNPPRGVHSMIASPLLISDSEIIGGLVLGHMRPEKLSHWDVTVVQAVSYQMGLIAHFSQVLQKLEYQVVMAERARLAREVHDGIAQTLGFLKLMATQIDGYFQRKDYDRLQKAINLSRNTLADAYMDARHAIDGLRITPENGLQSWLKQAAREFTDNYGIPIRLIGLADVRVAFPPEVQAQLIRIVQEALTNVRKHAKADEIRIECRQWEGDFFLEIEDNGCGFEPEQALKPSQHGMLGMRERAELIGADFQVATIPQKGTVVQVRLPFETDEIEAYAPNQ